MPAQQQGSSTVHVRISKATQILWEGEALHVSSKNVSGPFDILPIHSNFISLIRNEPIKVMQADGVERVYQFKESVIYVNNNEIKVFAEL